MDRKNLPKSRGEAIKLGATRYFTGKPCKNGHIALRRAPNANCLECQKINGRKASEKYRKTDNYKQYQKEYQSEYRYAPENKERLRAIQKKYYIKKYYNGDEQAYESAQAKRRAKREGKA